MSLSDAEVAQVVDELAPRLLGQSVRKVHDVGGHTLYLEVGRERLVLSAHPRASRLHPLVGERAARGEEPSAFSMLLRKRLGGLRLEALRLAAPGERVVVFEFGAGRDRLLAELTGPHANAFLVDAQGLIVASLRPSRGATRPLPPGAAWTPPPPAPADAAWRGRRRFGEPPGVAARVAAHYAEELRRAEERELRERAAVALRRELDRLARREAALVEDLRRIDEAAVYRKYGDLLLAHLGELPGRGAASAAVPDDFEDGAPLTIALDPALDGRENAARYYRQHKRLTGGRKRAAARLAETRAALDAARARLAALPSLDLAALRALTPPPRAREVAPRARARRGETPAALPYREFRSLAGDVIRVGRSAADNDALTFGHARGSDLWLHARDAPGAHVVVRLPSNRPLPEASLVDAATLAAHYSPLAREAQVDVQYTQVKNLRKPRGGPPGLVYVSGAKTIRVRMEPERLDRLLRQLGEPMKP